LLVHNIVHNLDNIDASMSGVVPGLAANGERMERQIQDYESNLQQFKQQLNEERARREMAAGEAAESRSKLLMEVQARKELAAALSEATASFEIQISEFKSEIDDLEKELAGTHKQLQELALAKQEREERQEALLRSTLDGAKRLDTAICTMHAAIAAMCSKEKHELDAPTDATTDADAAEDLGRLVTRPRPHSMPHSLPCRPAGFPKTPSTATASDTNMQNTRRRLATSLSGAPGGAGEGPVPAVQVSLFLSVFFHTLFFLFVTLTCALLDRSC
jgi:hypothetical protein